MADRKKFENWAQGPKRQWSITRFDEDDHRYRAGHYCNPVVQYAWEAWQASHDSAMADIDEIIIRGTGG